MGVGSGRKDLNLASESPVASIARFRCVEKEKKEKKKKKRKKTSINLFIYFKLMDVLLSKCRSKS